MGTGICIVYCFWQYKGTVGFISFSFFLENLLFWSFSGSAQRCCFFFPHVQMIWYVADFYLLSLWTCDVLWIKILFFFLNHVLVIFIFWEWHLYVSYRVWISLIRGKMGILKWSWSFFCFGLFLLENGLIDQERWLTSHLLIACHPNMNILFSVCVSYYWFLLLVSVLMV